MTARLLDAVARDDGLVFEPITSDQGHGVRVVDRTPFQELEATTRAAQEAERELRQFEREHADELRAVRDREGMRALRAALDGDDLEAVGRALGGMPVAPGARPGLITEDLRAADSAAPRGRVTRGV